MKGIEHNRQSIEGDPPMLYIAILATVLVLLTAGLVSSSNEKLRKNLTYWCATGTIAGCAIGLCGYWKIGGVLAGIMVLTAIFNFFASRTGKEDSKDAEKTKPVNGWYAFSFAAVMVIVLFSVVAVTLIGAYRENGTVVKPTPPYVSKTTPPPSSSDERVTVVMPPIHAPKEVMEPEDIVIGQPYQILPDQPLRIRLGLNGFEDLYDGGMMSLTYSFKGKPSEMGMVGAVYEGGKRVEILFANKRTDTPFGVVTWTYVSGNPTVTFTKMGTRADGLGVYTPGLSTRETRR